MTELEKEMKKIQDAMEVIMRYGQIDGDHHKAWVIDQVSRILLDDKYDAFIKMYEYDEEEDEIYEWDVGIAP